jgi:large subunit ribosomal protein L2
MNILVKKSPTTPSLRHVCLVKKKFQKKDSFVRVKDQGIFFKNNAGRNNSGTITVYGKGGGHKKRYRVIFFERRNLSGIVEFLEHDPFRSANIARIYSKKFNIHFYILAPQGLDNGHFVDTQTNCSNLNFKIGNLFFLNDLPLGTLVHNVLVNSKITSQKIKLPHKDYTGGFIRAAGCSATLISKSNGFCRLRLASGEHKNFSCFSHATLGSLSNPLHNRKRLGKAGRFRWLNHRPTVRGVAMNPIDHPHGGGEGKTSGGRPSVTPWGRLTRGQPTRKSSKRALGFFH